MITNSLTMPRILKMEPKNRERVSCTVENELLMIMRQNTLDISNTVNIALEKHLIDKGLLKLQQ